MLCFAALVVERRLLRPDPDRRCHRHGDHRHHLRHRSAGAADQRNLPVLYFGQGSEFYTQNPLFWWKVGLI